MAEVRAAALVIESEADPGLPGQGKLLILAVDMTGDRSLRDYEFDQGEQDVIDDPLVFLAQPDSIILTREFADRNHIVPNQDGMVREGGKYSFKNIRPGKYWLFAIDAFRSGPASSEEDFKRIAAAAEEIEIKADEKIAKDLKVLLKEDVDARNKK